MQKLDRPARRKRRVTDREAGKITDRSAEKWTERREKEGNN